MLGIAGTGRVERGDLAREVTVSLATGGWFEAMTSVMNALFAWLPASSVTLTLALKVPPAG